MEPRPSSGSIIRDLDQVEVRISNIGPTVIVPIAPGARPRSRHDRDGRKLQDAPLLLRRAGQMFMKHKIGRAPVSAYWPRDLGILSAGCRFIFCRPKAQCGYGPSPKWTTSIPSTRV